MTSVQGFNLAGVTNPKVLGKTQGNYNINFRAGNGDTFVRESSSRNDIDAMIKKREKEEKNNKFWNKVGILTGIAASAAIIFMAFKGMNVGGFKASNLEFKNFKNDNSIFDLAKSESLHPDVKKYFMDMAEREGLAKDIAKRAGMLGEAGNNALILLGNSGVGKSEIVKAYAKYVDADYVAISLADFANSYVNGTAINIKEMFKTIAERAKKNPNKQIVVSLDEIDAIIKKGGIHASDEVGKNRQSFITCLDEILKIPNIRVFGSTNAEINALDAASVRRLGHNFTVPMPNKNQLKEALKFQLRNCEGAMENNGKFFNNNPQLDAFLDKLIERECAFGDVKNIVKKARESYGLKMHRDNNKTMEFSVDFLSDALKSIQKTAGEMAKETGAAM